MFLNNSRITIYADGHKGSPLVIRQIVPNANFRRCVRHQLTTANMPILGPMSCITGKSGNVLDSFTRSVSEFSRVRSTARGTPECVVSFPQLYLFGLTIGGSPEVRLLGSLVCEPALVFPCHNLADDSALAASHESLVSRRIPDDVPRLCTAATSS